MDNIYIYFTHNYRGSIYRLHVDTAEELTKDSDEDEKTSTEELWKNLEKRSDCLNTVVKLSRDELIKHRWLIVFDSEVISCRFSGEEENKDVSFFLTDIEPWKFIAERFIESKGSCERERDDDDYQCELKHREDLKSEDDINIEYRYCNVSFYSLGEQDGLRLINANKDYPSVIGRIEDSHDPEDYFQAIYVFDTTQITH